MAEIAEFVEIVDKRNCRNCQAEIAEIVEIDEKRNCRSEKVLDGDRWCQLL